MAAAYHDAFLTVSDITANECKYLLGREPDGVTPNGLRTTSYGPARSTTPNATKPARR